ncbi:uncharacterized protein [Scyliorhinus torazame]|uniref:uncharacterized protein isoform X2 n=1 Tax=Scyliorhinus torazame TaxID=75743 RepID=UPI003B58CA5A
MALWRAGMWFLIGESSVTHTVHWQTQLAGRVMAAHTPKTSHIDIWIALRRLDLNDEEVPIVKDVCIGRGLDMTATKQVLLNSFGIEDATLVLKLRNSRGSLVPMNGELNVNSKQSPYILEVTKLFQHVVPKTRTDVMTVINKGLKNRLQSIMKREIELLNQKLRFLNQRMEIAESHSWKGMFKRQPLW